MLQLFPSSSNCIVVKPRGQGKSMHTECMRTKYLNELDSVLEVSMGLEAVLQVPEGF